ncbi:MAG: hypothetical protein RIC16_03850 [Rhodospirillales bacterium]
MRRALKVATVSVSLVVGVPVMVNAAMAVIDAQAVGKLADQLNKLQQQLDQLREQTGWLNTMSEQLQDQIDAVGKMGKITLPTLNLENVANKIRRDVQCLVPDLSNLMPGIDFEEMDFNSICEGRSFYKKALWFDPEDLSADDGETERTPEERWSDISQARGEIEARREAVTKDVAAGGMAAGDLAATAGASEAEKAASDLEVAENAAETEQDRLAVIAQGTVLNNKQLVQQNQLLAQLLKVQSTMLMQMSVPSSERPSDDGESGQ